MKEAPRTVSALLVTYNSSADVGAAIESVEVAAREAGLALELIVIDNASSDGSIDIVRRTARDARVIANAENVGFGRATNQGLAVASGGSVLLLNPDARLAPDALGILHRELGELAAGAVAPTIGEAGAESAGMAPGLRSAAGHFLGLNRLLRDDGGGPWRGVQVRRRGGDPRPVEWASAAVLLLDAGAMRAIGGFDERFFMYGEDVDLCLRLGRSGRRIWLVPAAQATHAIAASQGGVSTGWVDALHDMARLDGGAARGAAFDLLMASGLTARAIVAGAGASGFRSLHARRMRAAARRAWRLLVHPRSREGHTFAQPPC